MTLPAMVTSGRGLLKFSGFAVTINAVFSLVLGLYMWGLTLRTKSELHDIWVAQDARTQDVLQAAVSSCHGLVGFSQVLTIRQFSCCGFYNSTSPAFVTDETCPSPASAALMTGCAGPLTSFANVFVDDIFTAVFAFVGFDAVLILATAALLKQRKERERFRYIDEKSGAVGAF